MGDKVDQIERHIERQRDELRGNMIELRHRATEAVNWRAQVDARPMTMLGIAFGGGVLLSILLGGRQAAPRGDNPEAQDPSHAQALAGVWNQVKGALLAIAVTKIGSSMESVLPGFQDEYRKASREPAGKTAAAP